MMVILVEHITSWIFPYFLKIKVRNDIKFICCESFLKRDLTPSLNIRNMLWDLLPCIKLPSDYYIFAYHSSKGGYLSISLDFLAVDSCLFYIWMLKKKSL